MTDRIPDFSAHILAHRGYAARYPENSLPAIMGAVAAGARLIEFDIQLTADKVPVLLHDADFVRTGGRPESILDIDYARVCELDVAERARFGEQFAGVRAPALRDVVSQLREWPDVTAFVELKRQSIERFGGAAVLDAVMAELESIATQCVIISFEYDVLVDARQRYGLPVGWALREYSAASHKLADELSPAYLFCNQTRLPSPDSELWQGAWQWIVYEVIDPAIAEQLFVRGVYIVESMAYPELAEALMDRASDR